MSRSRDLANLANNATGLETLTVSDITDLTATATELNYVDGVSSALQTQIDAKQASSGTFNGTIGSSATFPTRHILQVKHGFYNGITSGSGTTPALIDSSLSVTIKPNHASNKILIIVSVTMIPQTNSNCGVLLYKDSSELTGANNSNPDSSSNRVHYFLSTHYHSQGGTLSHQQLMIDTLAGSYEDTAGSTNDTTYAVYARGRDSSHNYYINRCQNDSSQGDDNAVSRGTSSITVMEIQV